MHYRVDVVEDVRTLILIVIERRMGGEYAEEDNVPMHNAIYRVGVFEDIRTLILAWEENMSRRTMHQRTLPTPPIEDGLCSPCNTYYNDCIAKTFKYISILLYSSDRD